VTTWTEAAYRLTDTLREPGFTIAGLVASAWCAGVDPYATKGLVSAAHVLAGHEVMVRLWDRVDPCPDAATLLTGAEEAEAEVAGMLRHAGGMAEECTRTRDRAGADYSAAVGAQQAATTQDEHDAAVSAAQAAGAAIDDCDNAREILGGVCHQLSTALDALRQAPDDLAGTYETAYSIVHAGGKLPHSGRFLTGAA
jgi:hypothetical protein